MSVWSVELAEDHIPTEGIMLPPRDQSGTAVDYMARHRKAINERDARHRDRVIKLARAFDKVKADGMRRAIELVWEVGTGYSDRTKAIADHIESEIRTLGTMGENEEQNKAEKVSPDE